MDAETKADLRVKVRRRVSEYIQKSGLPLNRTGSGETEAVCPNCGQTAAVKKIPLEEHFEFWKCDSCGAEGDAVQYAMHHLRTASEDEALLDVCRKLGVAIPFLPTITAKELMEKEFPPRVELIEGMLGPGLYILAGAPKIGKSWLVLQIAHHISTGTPLWDRRVSRHAVLYLCLEDTLQRIQSRLLTICDGETGDVTFSIEAGILGDGFEKQLIAYLRSHADTKVVIVDTLAKVRGAVSSSNVYSSDYAAMNVFKHLADTFKIALILVHHTRKQVVGHVDLIQSVDRRNLMEAIEKEAAKKGITQKILLEINIGNEESKSGFRADEIWGILEDLPNFPHLQVRGLMAIPPASRNPGDNLKFFKEISQLSVDIARKKYDNLAMECLSMGMSDDLPMPSPPAPP